MKIRILFATETGSAETLAEDLLEHVAKDHEASVASLDDPQALAGGADVLVLITSTYGDGELPRAAQAFYDRLAEAGSDVAGRPFAVFGLGDRQYADTFGQASRLIEQRMIEQGAVRVCEREVHDASGPEFMDDQAKQWIERVLDALKMKT